MARRRISILDNFLSGGIVGSSFLSSAKATLKDTTRMRSLVACADRYLAVARLLRLFSSLLRAGTCTGSADMDPHWTLSRRVSVSARAQGSSGWSGLSIVLLCSGCKWPKGNKAVFLIRLLFLLLHIQYHSFIFNAFWLSSFIVAYFGQNEKTSFMGPGPVKYEGFVLPPCDRSSWLFLGHLSYPRCWSHITRDIKQHVSSHFARIISTWIRFLSVQTTGRSKHQALKNCSAKYTNLHWVVFEKAFSFKEKKISKTDLCYFGVKLLSSFKIQFITIQRH